MAAAPENMDQRSVSPLSGEATTLATDIELMLSTSTDVLADVVAEVQLLFQQASLSDTERAQLSHLVDTNLLATQRCIQNFRASATLEAGSSEEDASDEEAVSAVGPNPHRWIPMNCRPPCWLLRWRPLPHLRS